MEQNNKPDNTQTAGKKVALEVTDLKKFYRVSNGLFKPVSIVKALNGVSFSLQEQECLAIVGESGCGKSTMARQLNLMETPTEGDVVINGQPVNYRDAVDIKDKRKQVQTIFQNTFASMNPRFNIEKIISEPLMIRGELSESEIQDVVVKTMRKVGLPEDYRRAHMFNISGGQRQRVAIARSLTVNPTILIADEPVSALDVSVQAQVLNLLNDLKTDYNLAMIFISHDLSVVEYVADKILVMYLGHVVEYGSAKEVFSKPRHPYTKALFSAAPKVHAHQRKQNIMLIGEIPSPLNIPTGCPFNTRCVFANDECRKNHQDLEYVNEATGHQVSCERWKDIA